MYLLVVLPENTLAQQQASPLHVFRLGQEAFTLKQYGAVVHTPAASGWTVGGADWARAEDGLKH
jgi:hypothetical protein